MLVCDIQFITLYSVCQGEFGALGHAKEKIANCPISPEACGRNRCAYEPRTHTTFRQDLRELNGVLPSARVCSLQKSYRKIYFGILVRDERFELPTSNKSNWHSTK